MTEPVKTHVATAQFQKERSHEVREATLTNQKYHLVSFNDWTESIGLEHLSELNGFTVNQYKTWRRDETDINEQTLYNNLMTIRVFLKWAEHRELVEDGLHEKLDIPVPEDPTRHTTIPPERAEDIIDHHSTYKFATREHILFYLLYHTGIRVGTVRALDVEDWIESSNRLRIEHRPETDTPLKNGKDANRLINIVKEELADALTKYIQFNRPDVEDEYGRKPLIPSRQGRPTTQTLRLYTQHLTRPCLYADCPHDRDPASCSANIRMRDAYECPSAISPHPIRRSAITDHLNRDVPKPIVSERMNVNHPCSVKRRNRQTALC